MARPKRSKTTNDGEQPSQPPDDNPDQKLVEDAVEWIQGKLKSTYFKGMSEIGEYVFDRFFAGDVEQLRSRNPNKNASFRALVERCESTELSISKSTLHRAVLIAVMQRQLPDGDAAFKQLPPSHQAVLLPIRDPEKIEKVAQKAISREISVRKLKELVDAEVAKAKPDGERRGRPPAPVIAKTIARSMKLFTPDGTRRTFLKAEIDELTDEQAQEALTGAKAIVGILEKLIERLEARG